MGAKQQAKLHQTPNQVREASELQVAQIYLYLSCCLLSMPHSYIKSNCSLNVGHMPVSQKQCLTFRIKIIQASDLTLFFLGLTFRIKIIQESDLTLFFQMVIVLNLEFNTCRTKIPSLE